MEKLESITIEDNEPYLRQISKEVQTDDRKLQENIEILEKFCKENEVMAMAAVQLGIPKRLIYIKNTNLEVINRCQIDAKTEEDNNYNEARVLINPVIKEKIGLTSYWEACASCLDNVGLVKRPYKIIVEYIDIEKNKHYDTFEGFESTVLSHEMDHLDGILHIDIAEEIRNLSVEERKKLRQEQGYNIYTKTGNYEELIKNTRKI